MKLNNVYKHQELKVIISSVLIVTLSCVVFSCKKDQTNSKRTFLLFVDDPKVNAGKAEAYPIREKRILFTITPMAPSA